MDVAVGLRVVRGPQWEWEDQDGGEGNVGTVVATEARSSRHRFAVVQWDSGERFRYGCGADVRFELRVLDSAQAGIQHRSTQCNWCRCRGITGLLWHCMHCLDYFLCSQCYNSGRHSLEHVFERIDSADKTKRTRLSCRLCCRRVALRGVFRGATIERGPDWIWNDQDGGEGQTGKVTAVKNWRRESYRSVVEVQWASAEKKNIYRMGHNGKVDVSCVAGKSGRGGYYYPDHLPALGARLVPPDPKLFSAGDSVTMGVDVDMAKLLQEEHGGWNDKLFDLVGGVAMVNSVLISGDLILRMSNNTTFTVNSEVLVKSEEHFYMVGDIVRVVDDMGLVHRLQEAGPGWNDDMACSVGQLGEVLKKVPPSGLVVRVCGRRWILDTRCLVPTPDATLPNNAASEDLDVAARLKVYSLISDEDNPLSIIYAVAAGDVDVTKRLLDKFPGEINSCLALGKAPIHAAITEGYPHCVRALLEYGPDLELEDKTGEKPLHLCAYVNQAEAAQLVIDAGAQVNSFNGRGTTPLMVAAAVGTYAVVKVLIDCPRVDLNARDAVGNTVLQTSIISRRNKSIAMLLDAGCSPLPQPSDTKAAIHDAVGYGLVPSIERIITHSPDQINCSRRDGYTPLHICAAQNFSDIVSSLAQHNLCDLDMRTSADDLTPLHIAVHEGHSAVVERLVGFGADVNAKAIGGNTVLHLGLARRRFVPPNEYTPQLLKVKKALEDEFPGQRLEPYVIVVCFLIQEGADLDISDKHGQSPLLRCPPDTLSLIMEFSKLCTFGNFCGTLRSTRGAYPPSTVDSHVTTPSIAHSPLTTIQHLTISSVSDRKDITTTTKFPIKPRESFPAVSSVPTVQAASYPTIATTGNTSARSQSKHTSKPDSKEVMNSIHSESVATTPGLTKVCTNCDETVDVRLGPCDHSVLCLSCAKLAKKCPECLIIIQDIIQCS